MKQRVRIGQASDQQAMLVVEGVADVWLSRARPALSLLVRSRVLLAVTLQLTDAGSIFEITVSKPVNEASQTMDEYWWEVAKLTTDGRGPASRERRWGMGLQPSETAEAAYLTAVSWVEAHAESADGCPLPLVTGLEV